MNLKKVSAKVLSVVMALAMMLAVCAPAILAATEETEGKKELNYVSLGDSMTNGLGHDGYWNNGYLEEAPVTYAAKLAAWLAGVADSSKFTENADGTVTFNGDKAIVNWVQLATSAARAEDLHYILEVGKTNAYPGDMWTYTELLGGHSIGPGGSNHIGQSRWGKDGVLFEGYAEMFQESVIYAVHAAIVSVPKKFTLACTTALDIPYITACKPAGTPTSKILPNILKSTVHSDHLNP